MKVYLVKDCFTGTFGDGEVTIDSAWTSKIVANAVANSRYAHSVEEIEVNEGEEVPVYAKDEYKKILKSGKLNKWERIDKKELTKRLDVVK